MPRGDKSSYSSKQKRMAEHIEDGYEKHGVPAREAARRAWATVNKETGGGKKSGSGRSKAMSTASSKKGGRIGGKRSHSGSRTRKTAAKRSAKKTSSKTNNGGALSFFARLSPF